MKLSRTHYQYARLK